MKRLQDRYNVAISASEITYSQKKKKKCISKSCFHSSICRNNFCLKRRNEDKPIFLKLVILVFHFYFIKILWILNFEEHGFHIRPPLRQI